MLTINELERVILAPVILSAIIAAIGLWRSWRWAMPLAAGAGFCLGYALIGVPQLPPQDGTDWLFWLAAPVTILGVLDAVFATRVGWLAGAAAGGAVAVLLRPLLVSGSVSPREYWLVAAALAGMGAVLCLVVDVAASRLGSYAAIGALCMAMGGAAVVVLSSNSRIGGVYGLAAAAALGPAAVLSGRLLVGRSVAIVAVPLLAGSLAGGHYYADPGVSWVNLGVLMASPLLLLAGLAVPGKKKWIRAAVALVLVAIAVGIVAAPTALAAKKAAEADTNDPYK